MNCLIEQANNMLYSQSFDYAFCGGLAIDLFLGYETRVHSDIDIHAYWEDRNNIILFMQANGFEVYEMLGGGKAFHITDINNQKCFKRNIFCIKNNCELVNLTLTDDEDIYIVDFDHIGQTKLNYIEFLFNRKNATDFLYARDENVKRSLNKAILYKENIPYLAPEVCLLYKSTDTERNGYQQDFDLAIAKMDFDQKEWLENSLDIMFPNGHKWSNEHN